MYRGLPYIHALPVLESRPVVDGLRPQHLRSFCEHLPALLNGSLFFFCGTSAFHFRVTFNERPKAKGEKAAVHGPVPQGGAQRKAGLLAGTL
jgi:hypothetical protein